MMTFFRNLFLLALTIITLGYPQFAQANAGDEARLKTLFQAMLDQQKQAAEKNGGELVLEGDIQIENAGSYYAITLPHATLKNKNGTSLEIGLVAVNASAQPTPGTWKMTIALPTPFVLKDTGGKPLMSLHIGGQSATGIWNEKIEYFTQMNATYRDITAEDTAKSFIAKLPALTFKTDLKETTPGKWSGPIETRLGKLEVTIPQKQTKISLKSGAVQFDLLSYDPALIKAKRTQIEALQQNAQENPASKTPPSAEHKAAIGNLIFDLLTKSGEGLRTNYAIEEFEIIAPQPGQTEIGRFSLAKASMSVALTGFAGDRVSVEFGLDYDGLDPKPLTAQMQNILPREAHLDWKLNNVPLQQLAATLNNSLGGMASASPQMSQMGAAALLFKLPAILSQAETKMVVEKNFIANDLYRAELNGGVGADISAFTGFVSDFVLGVYGLDNLITALENAASEPTTMYRSTIGSWASTLKYLKGFGAMQKDEQDTTFHRYHFELTPQGQMLLNDKDAAAMFSKSILPPLPADTQKPAVTPPAAAQ